MTTTQLYKLDSVKIMLQQILEVCYMNARKKSKRIGIIGSGNMGGTAALSITRYGYRL